MNKTDVNKLIPKLRFPEFQKSDNWRNVKIGGITKVSTGGTPESNNSKYWNGEIPWMNSGELNNKRIYSVSNFITKKGYDNSSTKLLPHSCVLIGLAGQGKTRGTAAINYIELCTNQSIAAIHPNKEVYESEFLYHKLDSQYEKLRALSAGDGGRGGLNLEIIKSLEISLPSLEEQKKIAACLSSLDDLITAENQKLETLKAHKNGLLQNLFPSEGETVPKLRFKEFEESGEWEKKTLLEVCKMQAGKFINASEITEKSDIGLYPCYGGNGLRGYTQTFTHSGIFSLIGRQGALCGNVVLAEGKFHATEHAIVVTPEKNIDTIWLYFALIILNLNDFATGQAQPGLSVKNLEKIELCVPTSFDEQIKIGSLLLSIDDLISKQNEKVEIIKFHKKGLLQGLFPDTTEITA